MVLDTGLGMKAYRKRERGPGKILMSVDIQWLNGDEPTKQPEQWDQRVRRAPVEGLSRNLREKSVSGRREWSTGSNAAWRSLNVFLEVENEAENVHWI